VKPHHARSAASGTYVQLKKPRALSNSYQSCESYRVSHYDKLTSLTVRLDGREIQEDI
jgi:hypothetical protein